MKVSCVTGNIHIRYSYTFPNTSLYIATVCVTNNYSTSARWI